MNKIWLVTKREYLTRVKKKSFIIMTLLAPVLIAALWGGLIWVGSNEASKQKEVIIKVVDESGLVAQELKGSDKMMFVRGDEGIEKAKADLDSSKLYGILYFPATFTIERPVGAQLITKEQSSIANESRVENSIEKTLKNLRMEKAGLSKEKIDSLNVKVSLAVSVNKAGKSEEGKSGIYTIVGMALAFIMYMFVFIYGAQVMRGVLEEKTNRIVEVVISSVRPFNLMMGKIIGIALVGLTQFIIWVVLSGVLTTIVALVMGISLDAPDIQVPQTAEMQNRAEEMAELFKNVASINYTYFLSVFVFYFIGGYLLYSSLFAAIGSAVDNETDTQQFMFPITIPIIFSIVVAQASVVNDPHSPLAFWMSMIPLTSPVVMMVRLPFLEGHYWQLYLSMFLLVLGFLGSTWLAAKIYRTGILMYGKKVTYKELFKWLRYKG